MHIIQHSQEPSFSLYSKNNIETVIKLKDLKGLYNNYSPNLSVLNQLGYWEGDFPEYIYPLYYAQKALEKWSWLQIIPAIGWSMLNFIFAFGSMCMVQIVYEYIYYFNSYKYYSEPSAGYDEGFLVAGVIGLIALTYNQTKLAWKEGLDELDNFKYELKREAKFLGKNAEALIGKLKSKMITIQDQINQINKNLPSKNKIFTRTTEGKIERILLEKDLEIIGTLKHNYKKHSDTLAYIQEAVKFHNNLGTIPHKSNNTK